MRRDPDPQLEATVRHQLTRLIDAIETTPAEQVDLDLGLDADAARVTRLDRARAQSGTRRQRTLVLTSVAVAAAVALLALVVLPRGGDDPDDSVSTHGGGAPRRPTTTETSTTTSTTATTQPDLPGAGPGSAPADDLTEDCDGGVARDGVVAGGTLPDSRRWSYRVTGPRPDVDGEVTVAGAPVADGSLSAESQQDALADDRLVWGHVVPVGAGIGEIADFVVPAAAATVDAYVWDGSRRETVTLCARGVPDIDELEYAALFTPAGSEVVAVVARDAEGAPVAHSDLVVIPAEGGPETMTEVAAGELPQGRWSFQVGGDAELLALKLSLPPLAGEGAGAAVRTRPELLQTTWYASSAGSYFLWGYTRDDVAEVVVTSYEGDVHRIPTRPLPQSGVGGRVFAGEIPTPNGPSVRLIEGRTADGQVVVELREPEDGAIGNGMPEQANTRIRMREVG